MFKHSLSTLNSCGRRLLSVQQTGGYDFPNLEKKFREPFDYVKNIPYKHHTLLVPTFNYWLQAPKEKTDCIQEAVWEWITWAVIIDDIRDNSQFRHGAPTANRAFGVGATINAATRGLFKLQKQMLELGHPLAIKLFIKRSEEAFYGEDIDTYWRNEFVIPSEEAYIEMTKLKGGAYFLLPVELMQLFSSNKTNYNDLVTNIGSYYEMLDDYYNLFHPKALLRLPLKTLENHRINSDITEGNITLAIIHASQFPDVATELADILKQRTSDPKLQNRFVSLLKKYGSDEYTRAELRKLEADIRAQIEQLGGNPELTALMDDLSFQSHELPPEEELYT